MAQGSIKARVVTSNSDIPLFNAAVIITTQNDSGERELLAYRLTETDGLTESIPIETPDAAESQEDVPGNRPFTVVEMMAEQVGYDRIIVENVQVFPGVETVQAFRLIPTAELPDAYDLTDIFEITDQNL